MDRVEMDYNPIQHDNEVVLQAINVFPPIKHNPLVMLWARNLLEGPIYGSCNVWGRRSLGKNGGSKVSQPLGSKALCIEMREMFPPAPEKLGS